jgi:hypothetical protein
MDLSVGRKFLAAVAEMMQAVKPAALILMPLEFLGVPGILSTPWAYPFVVSGRQYSNVLHLRARGCLPNAPMPHGLFVQDVNAE